MTEKIHLRRSFLRNPINSIGILLTIALLFEGFSWAAGYNIKMAYLQHVGGIWMYVGRILQNMIFPELCTLYVLIRLIEWYHKLLKIDWVEPSWRSISRYELKILPILFIAFFVFNPFTQSVRFLLDAYPDYSFKNYWFDFIIGTYTPRIYIMYLVPIIFIGYLAVNGSLIADYIIYRNMIRKEAAIAAAAEKMVTVQEALAPKPAPKSNYLTTVKGRNAQGEMIFPVEECCYFMVEDRFYYVIHPKGRYQVSKTLNELEAELNPAYFFRANRGAILNRRTIQSYAYWERGKYIIRLNAICQQAEIALPRARLQEFRDWLGGDVMSGPQSTMFTDSF